MENTLNTPASSMSFAALGATVAGVFILICLIISGVVILGLLYMRSHSKTIDMVCFFLLSAIDTAADVV